MGQMKDIFTELHEQGFDPSTSEGKAKFEQLVEERFPGRIPKQGTFESLPLVTQEQIRKASPNAQFEEAVQQKFQHAKHVLLSKHKDYGPKNIAHSPGGPLNGLRVRMWDKFARINNLIDSKKKPEHESLRDSFLDMANYAIIAMLVLDDEWPNE